MMHDTMAELFIRIGMLLATAVVSFLASWFWFKKNNQREDMQRQDERSGADRSRIEQLEKQLAALTQNVLPISAAFQAILIKQLTHFHTPELDALLEGLERDTLTAEDEKRLATLLEQRTQDMGGQIDDSEREAAVMLPLVNRRVRAETAADLALQVVAVPKEAASEK